MLHFKIVTILFFSDMLLLMCKYTISVHQWSVTTLIGHLSGLLSNQLIFFCFYETFYFTTIFCFVQDHCILLTMCMVDNSTCRLCKE